MKKVILALAIGGLLWTGAVMAEHGVNKGCCGWGRAPHDKGMGAGMGGRKGRHPVKALLAMKDELKLSDSQASDLKKLSFDFRTSQVDLKADLEKARIKLQQLKFDEDVSEQAVMKAIDKVSQARAALEKLRYSFHSSVRSLLTEKQRQKMKELRKARKPGLCGLRGGPRQFLEKEIIIEDDGGI